MDDKHEDLGRMYQLVSRIQDGLNELRGLLEEHITQQGLAAIEKGGEAAHNDPKVSLSHVLRRSFTNPCCYAFRFTLQPFWTYIGSTML